MEIFSLLLDEGACVNPCFAFHLKCASLKLIHLCFADDLLIFSGGNCSSIQIIKDASVDFERLSGLKANPAKSSIFCAGMDSGQRKEIIDLLGMNEGTLHVRYLGVPLIMKNLSAVDCECLINRVTARMDSWLSKHLSFASRLQLISSILFSLQIFCGMARMRRLELKWLGRKFVCLKEREVWVLNGWLFGIVYPYLIIFGVSSLDQDRFGWPRFKKIG